MAFFKKNAYFSLAVGIALLALILFLLIVGYAQIKSAQQKAKSAKKSAKIQVLVDSDAIASFVERVGGDAVRVETAPRGVQASDLDKATRARLAATNSISVSTNLTTRPIRVSGRPPILPIQSSPLSRGRSRNLRPTKRRYLPKTRKK